MRPDVIDGYDIRITRRGRGAYLLVEALQPLVVPGELRVEDFDGNIPAQPGVSRSIHGAHAAGAEQLDDFVDSDTITIGEDQF